MIFFDDAFYTLKNLSDGVGVADWFLLGKEQTKIPFFLCI